MAADAAGTGGNQCSGSGEEGRSGAALRAGGEAVQAAWGASEHLQGVSC